MNNEPNLNTEDNNIRFIVESAFAKQEKANNRLFVISLVQLAVIVISIILLVITYRGWIKFMDSYETTTTTTQTITQETDGEGGNYIGNFVGGDNDGEIQTDSDNDDN